MNLAELSKLYDFTGRSVVMTGGTGVLGRVMAQAIIGCGANVAILARNREKADALFSETSGSGKTMIIEADALQKDSLERAAEVIGKEFGSVDCLVNGAGGNHPQATTRPNLSFFDIPEEALRLGVNSECLVDERLSPVDARLELFGGQSRREQFHPVAGSSSGGGVLAAHSRQCDCPGFLPD